MVISMNKLPNFTQIQKKTFYSTLIDGTNELFLSILFCFIGFIFFLSNLISIVIEIFFFILLFKKPNLLEIIKVKYIYPRLGYVKFSENHQDNIRKFHIILLFIALFCNSLYLLSIFLSGWSIENIIKYLPIIMGGALMAKTIFVFLFSEKKAYLGFGIISFILAIAFILIPVPYYRDHTILYAWTESLILFILGSVRLYQFLKQNPLLLRLRQDKCEFNEEKN